MGDVNWTWVFTVMMPAVFAVLLIVSVIITIAFDVFGKILRWVGERFHHPSPR